MCTSFEHFDQCVYHKTKEEEIEKKSSNLSVKTTTTTTTQKMIPKQETGREGEMLTISWLPYVKQMS